jgi:3-deoxy-7-phosphoheptulonate synthase
MDHLLDCNVQDSISLPTPQQMRTELEVEECAASFVKKSRSIIHNILNGEDKRLLLIVGPCSIHDIDAGYEYAQRLAELSERVKDRIYIVMRTYFEKPRTSCGWRGLIMDPYLDGSYDLAAGLRLARGFLRKVIKCGVPTASEILDPITPQYIGDLICWAAIGARTVESQVHRQLASGLPMPIGLKNSTDGNFFNAINAIKAVREGHSFLGIDHDGKASAITTKGNEDCHIVLRGGDDGTNYEELHVSEVESYLLQSHLPTSIMIDCSHANSEKDYRKQPMVFKNVLQQLEHRDSPVIGMMLESNLFADKQHFPVQVGQLAYGVSITDACIDWETTMKLVEYAYHALGYRFDPISMEQCESRMVSGV